MCRLKFKNINIHCNQFEHSQWENVPRIVQIDYQSSEIISLYYENFVNDRRGLFKH